MRFLGQHLRQLSASIILVFLMLISTSEAQIPEDMVLYLPLDEGEGKVAVDLSIHNNNAEIKGNPKWVDGPFGMALELDGAGDYLVVENSPLLQLTELSRQNQPWPVWRRSCGLPKCDDRCSGTPHRHVQLL